MLILLLPFCGMTAPRLAPLKSYSFRIVFPFGAGRRASGDHPNRLTAVRVDNDDNPAGGILPNRHEPLLTTSERILSGKRKGVKEDRFSVGEANPMLPLIRCSFPGIPYNPHDAIIYIQYAYIKCPTAIEVSRNDQDRGDLLHLVLVTAGSQFVHEGEQNWTGSLGIRGCLFCSPGGGISR